MNEWHRQTRNAGILSAIAPVTGERVREVFVVGCVIFILSLAPRLYHLYQTSPYTLGGDAIVYDQIARSLVEGRGYILAEYDWKRRVGTPDKDAPTAWKMPGLPLFLAAHYSLFGFRFLPPRFSLVLVASLLPVATYLMARRCAGERAGRLAGVFMAVWPPAIFSYYSSSELLTEPLCGTLLAFAMLLLLTAKETEFRSFGLSGALLGAATLVRAETILLPFFLLPWFLGCRGGKRDSLVRFGIFLGSMLLILAPWIARNAISMHALVLSTHTDALFDGNNPQARGSWNGGLSLESPPMVKFLRRHPDFFSLSEVDKSHIYTREAMSFAIANPVQFVRLIGRKALLFFTPFTQDPTSGVFFYNFAFASILPFTAWGFFRSWRDPPIWLLRLPVLHILTVSLITFSHDRYRAPFEMFFVIIACLELDRLTRRFGSVRVAGVAGMWLAGNYALYVSSRSGLLYEWARAAYRDLSVWNLLR